MCVQNTPASLHHKILVKKKGKRGTSAPSAPPRPLIGASPRERRARLGLRATSPPPPPPRPSPSPPLPLPHAHALSPSPTPRPPLPAARRGPPRRATGAFGTSQTRKAEKPPKTTRRRGGPDAKKKAEHKTKSAHRPRKTPNEEIQRGQYAGHITNCPRTRNPELSRRKRTTKICDRRQA